MHSMEMTDARLLGTVQLVPKVIKATTDRGPAAEVEFALMLRNFIESKLPQARHELLEVHLIVEKTGTGTRK